MKKEKILEILKYYLAEDIEHLYYENRMYPTWVKRDELVERIAADILKNQFDRDELKELFRGFFIFHNDANTNTVSVDAYFDEWYDAKFPPKTCSLKKQKNL